MSRRKKKSILDDPCVERALAIGTPIWLLIEHPVIFGIIAIILILSFFASIGSKSKRSAKSSHSHSASFFQDTKKHRHGKCDGDCANCPPHYGYRYGRWYYGHGHIEGCEFGGNKGDGSV